MRWKKLEPGIYVRGEGRARIWGVRITRKVGGKRTDTMRPLPSVGEAREFKRALMTRRAYVLAGLAPPEGADEMNPSPRHAPIAERPSLRLGTRQPPRNAGYFAFGAANVTSESVGDAATDLVARASCASRLTPSP